MLYYFFYDNTTGLLLFLLYTEQYEYVNILALKMVENLENRLTSPSSSIMSSRDPSPPC